MNLFFQSGWVLTNVIDGPLGTFSGEVHGAYSVEENSTIVWNVGDPLSLNDRLVGTVNWEINSGGFEDIWFHIIDHSNNTIVFSSLIWQFEVVGGQGSAAFDLPASLWMEAKTSANQFDHTAPISGYDQWGTWQIVGTPDVVIEPPPPPPPPPPPEEPHLPWWYCPPKPPVEACPVRPEGFVPFDQYDTEFKFPLASSRVPSKIPTTAAGECQPCSPTLIEPEEPVDPDPVVCGWFGISSTTIPHSFNDNEGVAYFAASQVSAEAQDALDTSSWSMTIGAGLTGTIHFRVTRVANSYFVLSCCGVTDPSAFYWPLASVEQSQVNEDSNPENEWMPGEFDGEIDAGGTLSYQQPGGSEWAVSDLFDYIIEVYLCDGVPGVPPPVE